MKNFKYILKKIIIGVGIVLILNLITGCKIVHAYVRLSTTGGTSNPVVSSSIVNPRNSWPQSNTWMMTSNEWLTSIGQYFYLDTMNGNQLIVVADYYLGIETRPGVSLPTSYLNNSRNTLKASALRCGIGSGWATGYDNTYAPNISDFSVSLESDLSSNGYPHDVIHVKWKYSQKLSNTVSGGSNVSCWFSRDGNTDGLFMQVYGNTVDNLYFSYTANLSASVSGDPNTSVLQNISQQNQTIIDQNQTIINQNNQHTSQNTQIFDSINSQTNTIKDTNIDGANSEAQNMLNSINATDNTGLTGVITAPLSIINNLSQGCSPINLTIPYIDANVSIPCMSTSVYPKMASGGLIQTISIIINGFLIYRVIASLYAMVKNFKNPEEDKVEVVDL